MPPVSRPLNILAFDTCYDACSAAVIAGAARIGRYEPMRMGHAERLVPMIAEVLDEAGLQPRDIDRIAVTRGPGTFTGTRIGIAAARAVLLATGAEGFGFSSLTPIARAYASRQPDQGGGALVVARSSRRGTHDCQVFDVGGAPLCDPFAGTPDEILNALGRFAGSRDRPLDVIGSGAAELCERLVQLGCGRARIVEAPPGVQFDEPDACHLAACALGDLDPALHPLTPLYLRPADAKPSSAAPIPRVADRTP